MPNRGRGSSSDTNPEKLFTRSEFQTDEEDFSSCARGSGDSISSDTEVYTVALLSLDQDEGAAINRKSSFQKNCRCRVQLRRLEKN